jgi:ABC-type transport system involved in Fe-S cluster assembly fused permease/ATPase subunit
MRSTVHAAPALSPRFMSAALEHRRDAHFLLFNIAPTARTHRRRGDIWVKFSFELVIATAVMVVAYVLFTQRITDWRNALRQEMNDLDTATVARSIDSLLNYETVKYFTAETRETTITRASPSATPQPPSNPRTRSPG